MKMQLPDAFGARMEAKVEVRTPRADLDGEQVVASLTPGLLGVPVVRGYEDYIDTTLTPPERNTVQHGQSKERKRPSMRDCNLVQTL